MDGWTFLGSKLEGSVGLLWRGFMRDFKPPWVAYDLFGGPKGRPWPPAKGTNWKHKNYIRKTATLCAFQEMKLRYLG